MLMQYGVIVPGIFSFLSIVKGTPAQEISKDPNCKCNGHVHFVCRNWILIFRFSSGIKTYLLINFSQIGLISSKEIQS